MMFRMQIRRWLAWGFSVMVAFGTGGTSRGEKSAGSASDSFPVSLEPVLMTTMGKVAGLTGENEAIWKRFEGFVRARHKITELSGPGLSRETAKPAKSAKDQARENGVDVEIVRLHPDVLPGLALFHGVSVDRSQMPIDGPELVRDGGWFALLAGKDHFILPRFTGENPDSTTAVHDDFLICPFGTSLFDMMNCPRLAPRYRAVLRDAEQKGLDPRPVLLQLLALSVMFDLHLEPLAPAPQTGIAWIRRLDEISGSESPRIPQEVKDRLPAIPTKAPWKLPAPLLKKDGSKESASYHAIGYYRHRSQAFMAELKISPDKLYFATTMIASGPHYGP